MTIVAITFLAALLLGLPIISVLGLSAIIPLQIDASMPIIMIAQAAFSGANQIVLQAIAGFMLAGVLMEQCGITDGLLIFAKEAVGRMTGGYAILTIFLSTFFAALTGAGPACAAAVGTMTIPLMMKGGYDKNFSSSVAAVGGTLGVMIPPSNPMMVYALLVGLSVTDMFISGILPGLLIAFLLMVVAAIICKKRGYCGVKEPFTFMGLIKAIWKAKWGLFAPILILGGIYGGIVTATESAIVAVVYAVIIGICNKRLTLKGFLDALKQTAIMCGSTVSIVGIAAIFGRVLAVYQIPQAIGSVLLSITNNGYVLQILILGLMIFMGMWMEPLSSLSIMVPIFLPLMQLLHIDLVAFGIVLVITTQIAFITPPVAANLFVASQISGARIEALGKEVMPFLLILVFVALLVIFVPQIATCTQALLR